MAVYRHVLAGDRMTEPVRCRMDIELTTRIITADGHIREEETMKKSYTVTMEELENGNGD